MTGFVKLKFAICFFVAGIALLLTGCIWMRFLAFKNQLAEFDRYVRVHESEGLSFHFLKPVVRSQDVRQLLEVAPSAAVTNQNQVTWHWTFEKQLPPGLIETNNFDITFATSFTNNYLCRLTVPDHLLAFVPKSVVEGIFRSVGKAKIYKMRRALDAQWRQESPGEIRILTQYEFRQLLGSPYQSTNSPHACHDLYLYKPKSPSLHPSKTKPARVECAFARASGRLTQVKVSYLTYQGSVSFDQNP